MSQLILRESSNLDETSSDDELSDWQRDDMSYVKRMMQSSNKTDQRLIKLYKVQRANKNGIHIGFSRQIENHTKRKVKRLISTVLDQEDFIIPVQNEQNIGVGRYSKSMRLNNQTNQLLSVDDYIP